MRILLLDGTAKNTLAIARHLGRLSTIEIDVVSYTRFSIAFCSKYVRRRLLLPNPKGDELAFLDGLISELRRGEYDLLLPVGHKTFEICAANQETIREHTNLVVTSAGNMRLAASKAETYRLAERLGIPCPKSVYPTAREEIASVEIGFPAVIKAPFEAGDTIVAYARNRDELRHKFAAMCDRYDFGGTLPLLQEFIPGTGYGFFAYYSGGVCRHHFMHRRIREYPVTGGASTCAESCRLAVLQELGTRLLDHLGWDGVAMVEFKRDDRDGQFKLMEINPKFWGSLDLALEAGVHFPYYLVLRAAGKDGEIPAGGSYSDVRFQWLLNGEVFHFFERPRDWWAILKDSFRARNDLWWRDPLPNLFQLLKIAEYWVKRARRP